MCDMLIGGNQRCLVDSVQYNNKLYIGQKACGNLICLEMEEWKRRNRAQLVEKRKKARWFA